MNSMMKTVTMAVAAAFAVGVTAAPAMAQVTPPASTGNNSNAADQRENNKVNAESSMGNKEAPKSPAPTSTTSNDSGSSVHDADTSATSDGSGKGVPKKPAPTTSN